MYANLFAVALYFTAIVLLFNWLILFRKQALVRRFFYTQIKHIISKNENQFAYTTIHVFHMILYSFFLLRFCVIFLQLSNQLHSELILKHDIFYRFFRECSNGKDYFYPVTFIMLLLFCLLIEREIYFTPVDTITWRKYHDLVVINCDLYERSACALLLENNGTLSKRTTKSFVVIKARNTAFCLVPLPNFPTLSYKMRAKFIKAVFIMEKLSIVLIGFVCKFDIRIQMETSILNFTFLYFRSNILSMAGLCFPVCPLSLLAISTSYGGNIRHLLLYSSTCRSRTDSTLVCKHLLNAILWPPW